MGPPSPPVTHSSSKSRAFGPTRAGYSSSNPDHEPHRSLGEMPRLLYSEPECSFKGGLKSPSSTYTRHPTFRSFSAIYPLPKTVITSSEKQQITAQSLSRIVEAEMTEPDGRLVDITSGVKVAHLYWEETQKFLSHYARHLSCNNPTVEDIESFDPYRPSLCLGNSILLLIGKIPSYLDAALKALTLHTDACTFFITYWLPSMLKYAYIALCFIAQSSYEKVARIRVSPTPDIVTRVFMLFRGVRTDDVALAAARAAADDGTTFWSNVAGVDAVSADDRTLF